MLLIWVNLRVKLLREASTTALDKNKYSNSMVITWTRNLLPLLAVGAWHRTKAFHFETVNPTDASSGIFSADNLTEI